MAHQIIDCLMDFSKKRTLSQFTLIPHGNSCFSKVGREGGNGVQVN